MPFFIVLLHRWGTRGLCLKGRHYGIHLLVPSAKCDILLVARLSDPFQGQALSHCPGGLSGTCILLPSALWLQHAGTFRGELWADVGSLNPTGDIHLGRDPIQLFVGPP